MAAHQLTLTYPVAFFSLALLVSKGADVRLQWAPSHVGVMGNEEADRLALEFLNFPVAYIS